MVALNLKELLQQVEETSFDAKEDLSCAFKSFDRKIVVLDDDPTGIQTVHDIPVYTSFEEENILKGFKDEGMFFVLTNSRGLSATDAEDLNTKIAEHIYSAYKLTGKDFILVSRSDSTLRGHYPNETVSLKKALENKGYPKFDGEIICPFFIEGGRYTYGNIHYVLYGEELIPAGETEFAKDKSFGYSSSDLTEWIEEKTNKEYFKNGVITVSVETIRKKGSDSVKDILMNVKNFDKVIVNALSYDDIRIFLTGYIKAINEGKHFIFRSAAAIPKILGNVDDKPLLSKEQLRQNSTHGGLVVIGSHVKKTTRQLQELLKSSNIEPIEFNQHLVLDPTNFENEKKRVQSLLNSLISDGKDVCIYTKRERLDMNTGNPNDEIQLSRKISDAVTGFVIDLTVRPSYIIAKGGITSSEIGTLGLKVKRAIAMGQVLPGVPVWLTGAESRFPSMAYIIFPGNVGEDDSLANIVNSLQM